MKLFGSKKTADFGDLVNKGRDSYRSGQLNKAVEYFNQAVAVRSDVAEVFYMRGMAYARMGHMSGAIQDFEKVYAMGTAEKLNKRDACYNLGKAYDELQKFEESIRWYERATQLDPGFVNVYANRAGVHLKLGELKSDLHEFELAVSDLGTALSLNPSDPIAYFNRALANIQLQNFDQVNDDLQRFLELAPENHPYRREVEKMLAESTKSGSSKLDMIRKRKKQELWQKIVNANNERRYSEAIELCDKFLEDNRTDAGVWDEKSFALWGMGRPQEALSVCLEGISINPTGARLYNTKGGLLSELKQYREAIGAFEKYLAISPPEYAEDFPRARKAIEDMKRIVGE
jgi:tetratricopeptide (TPR) repeat protein